MSMVAYRSSFELRTITPDDKDAILDVYRRCEDFLALGPETKASMAMVLKDIGIARHEGGIFQGIYTAGKMIGVVSYVPKGFEGKPQIAFLSLLMIAAPYRRHGVGTEIVKRVEKEILMDSHVTTILSAVQVNNPAALRFWQKNDYRIVGGPELRPDSTTVFHLRKDCKPATQAKNIGG
jgi:GNAT superfamily N-acetyltransferase